MYSTQTTTTNCYTNANYINMSGLINYWSFCSILEDSVGQSHLFGANHSARTFDRFGSPSSALDLFNGFVQVPPGVYFYGDYTVTVWLYIRAFNSWSRLLDFGNGAPNDNVIFKLAFDTTGKKY